ncbi:MAG: hypothetical protein AAGC68_08335, partial [Verrucomicrobiota bacterium]
EEEIEAQMEQEDYAHSLKLFIRHNAPPNVVPGAGSAIFFHVWRSKPKPTEGCTTMSREHLEKLIAKIKPLKGPVYVLLPKAEYDKHSEDWGFPEFSTVDLGS